MNCARGEAQAPAQDARCSYHTLLLGDASRTDPHWRCPHAVDHEGLCLFHLPKLPIDERRKLTPAQQADAEELDKRCRIALAALMARTEADAAAGAHQFIGFELPGQFGISGPSLAKPVDFRRARFVGDASFAMCTLRDADFRGAAFFGTLQVYRVEFQGAAQFHDTYFHGRVRFSSSRFTGDAFFSDATFGADAQFTFDDRGFAALANFDRARFEQRAEFVGHGGEGVFHGIARFDQLSLPAGASLSFTNLSLAQADFYDCELQRVRFIGVRWNHLLGPRPRLWGEVRLLHVDPDPELRRRHGVRDWERPPQLEKLAETYAQLVLNHEQRRDTDAAEAFHIGEMEMRRRKLASHVASVPWRRMREHLNGFGLYRLSSLYGTSYGQAAAVLAALLLLLPLGFMATGLVATEAHGAPPRIEYRLLPDAQHPVAPPGVWAGDYARALLHTLSVATFQRERSFASVGEAGAIVSIVTVLLVGSQSAMLLLAVRRRFKR